MKQYRRIARRQDRPSVRALQALYRTRLDRLLDLLIEMVNLPYDSPEQRAMIGEIREARLLVNKASQALLRSVGFNVKLWHKLRRD